MASKRLDTDFLPHPSLCSRFNDEFIENKSVGLFLSSKVKISKGVFIIPSL